MTATHTGEGIKTECQAWPPHLLLLGTACRPRGSPVSVLNAWYVWAQTTTSLSVPRTQLQIVSDTKQVFNEYLLIKSTPLIWVPVYISSLIACHSFPCSSKMCRSQHGICPCFSFGLEYPSPSILYPLPICLAYSYWAFKINSGLIRKPLEKYSSPVFPLPLFHIELILSAYLFLLICGLPPNKNHFTSTGSST